MPRTIVALDPDSRVRGLLVEVHGSDAAPLPALLRGLERRLYERNIRVGLLVTPTLTHVVRDLVTEVHHRGNRFAVERPIPTGLLLSRVGVPVPAADDARLTEQVLLWLVSAAGAWSTFVPPEAMQAMVPEVVGQFAQLVRSDFEVWDALLDVHDAAG